MWVMLLCFLVVGVGDVIRNSPFSFWFLSGVSDITPPPLSALFDLRDITLTPLMALCDVDDVTPPPSCLCPVLAGDVTPASCPGGALR